METTQTIKQPLREVINFPAYDFQELSYHYPSDQNVTVKVQLGKSFP